MLSLARECRGWTQRDLARAIGVSQTAIGKYEAGLIRFPENEITKLCSALDFEPEFFAHRPIRVAPGGDFLYRKRANVSQKVRRRVEAEANIRLLQVERLLQSVELQVDHIRFPAIDPEEQLGRIDRVAQDVRQALRIPSGPISNVTRYIERAGGIVFAVDFETDLIDGTNIRMPGRPPLLFLNANVPGDRHRFNLAHELGHVVMHYGLAGRDAEEQANAFAREFLMPKALIRSDLRNLDLPAAARLKPVWGVSMAALIYRAHELGTISDYKYQQLFRSLNAKGMRSVEPVDYPFEQPEAFDELVESHRRNFDMTESDARRLLFTDNLGPREPVQPPPVLRLFRDDV